MDAKKQGKSVFLSSHILSEVEKLCDKVSIIRQGKIIETGTLHEMRHLTRTSVMVETKHPPTSLSGMKGVHDVTENSLVYTFQVDTEELGSVIKYLSNFDILKFENAPPTLEDLFMRHYQAVGGNL